MSRKSPYTVVVTLNILVDRASDTVSFLETIIPIAMRGHGCIRYDLHQSLTEPNIFFFYESWKNKEACDAHLALPEVQKWREELKAFLAKPIHTTSWELI